MTPDEFMKWLESLPVQEVPDDAPIHEFLRRAIAEDEAMQKLRAWLKENSRQDEWDRTDDLDVFGDDE